MDYDNASLKMFKDLAKTATFKKNVVSYTIYKDGTGVNMITTSGTSAQTKNIRSYVLKKLPEAGYTRSGW